MWATLWASRHNLPLEFAEEASRARRYDEAIRASQQALELDPQFINAFWWQGLSYAGKRDFFESHRLPD